MTRSAYAILISILVLLLIGLLSACGSTGEESRPDQGTPANPGNSGAPGPQGPVSEPAPEVVTAPMQPVYVTTSSLDSAPDGSSDDLSKLVAHSTLIVIGETPPNDPREERIQGRDPNDPSRPDPNYATIGNVYDIRVERFLKGSGDETLSVVQPIGYEAFVPGPPNTPGRITKGRDTTPNLLLQESSRYLLFLRENEHAPGLWMGTVQPYRFTLSGGTARVESPVTSLDTEFPDRTEVELVSLVESLITGSGPVDTEVEGTPRAEPSATETEVSDLVLGNGVFAFDLYRALSADDGNLFFSPYSISISLGMTYAGARGETEKQMTDTLSFLLPHDRLHPAFNTLHLDLDSRGGGTQNNDPSAFRLSIANALWGQQGHHFLDEFTTVVAENYGARVRPTDFLEQPEESRLRINDWVAEATENRIRDLIPTGKFDDQPPALVLTNAIYFNAGWLHEFSELSTPTAFHPLQGEAVDVPMMERSAMSKYAGGDGYQAVDLHYKFSKMSMTILLPDSGTFEEFESSLDYELVTRTDEDMESREVVLTMPRFEFESEFDLVDTLESMGMRDAFDGLRANFSGMDGQSCMAGDPRCLFLSDVIHKAFVAVDEEGTEAAAATLQIAIPMSGSALPPVEFTVDRPFIFLIRDRETGTILFVGRVLDPRA